jgi:SSS family solute:Na+ symporter
MIYILLIAYISILAFIAIRSYPKVVNYSDFFVARKKGNYFSITGSLVATILGGSAIIGAVDEGLKIGSATSWYMICASIGFLL